MSAGYVELVILVRERRRSTYEHGQRIHEPRAPHANATRLTPAVRPAGPPRQHVEGNHPTKEGKLNHMSLLSDG